MADPKLKNVTASGLGAAGAGAATGAALGSIVPGVGTALGAGLGAGIGWLGGALGNVGASQIDKTKNYDDLPWYQRAAATLSAKGEGAMRSIAGVVGLEDSIGTESQDLLDRLQHDASQDVATSFMTGGNITGATGGGGGSTIPQMGGGQGSNNEGQSLGRAIALEEEPALQEENYNNNNFSF